MKTTAGKSRCSQIFDPEKLRRSLLKHHPLCSAIESYQGEKPTIYRDIHFRSASEAKYGKQFFDSGIDGRYEVAKVYGPTGRGYKPDFYFPDLDFFMEVADFRGRYTQEKVENCKAAATAHGIPVVLVEGFPYDKAPDPLREVATTYLPGGIETSADPEIIRAAYPHMTAFFDAWKDPDMRKCMKNVRTTTFENLDEVSGEPRLERWAAFSGSNVTATERLSVVGDHALKLLFLLSTGYKERRFVEIAKDMGCTELEAARACKQLAEAQLSHKLAPGYEEEWRSLDLVQIAAEDFGF